MIRPLQTVAFITILSSISPGIAMTEISQKAKLNSSIRSNSIAQNLNAQAGDTLVNQQAYILGPGDEIQLTMFGQPNLFTTNYRVLVDGTVSPGLFHSKMRDDMQAALFS